ncbi:hypothetical protein [Nodosilinea sp. PGN35]|uniref:hypothetical protein n=1 Tax=Nodosilinea sp. PGN35 TaxID=3020489 RepID=UPI0023B33A5B|nr:hypothetical protein [Nodosilinea sp. TSF1-S3]MDF0368420.1 hypothetical protein [Nodosilinea sp. TSF1-S3]
MIELQVAAADTAARSYDVGLIQRTPAPPISSDFQEFLTSHTTRAWSLKRNLDTITQTSHAFILPALLQVQGATLSQRAQAWATTVATTEQELAQIQAEIDALAFDLYGISPEEVGANNPMSAAATADSSPSDIEEEDEDDTTESADLPSLVHGLIEYALGVALGRFDLRLATGEHPHPPEPEPFDPLPACSPGMLVTADGLPPTSTEALPPNYPIDIPFNGILVDDEGHPSDIIASIRQVLDLIWGDQVGDIEQEACQILRVTSLRDYIAKPSAFFAEHLSRYSKSRRQAPIYWPLSTRSGGYTLWLYYHRLTDQTLYTCINDFVEPKLHQVNQATTQLRSQTSRTRDEDKRLETLQILELELIDFRDELLRIAQLPCKPNLNDGVQITAAPLWPLFGLKKWQTKLKDTWKKLEKGDYDWAHLAYSIWPDRVRAKCKGDKSLAIAHDLETLYEAPPEKTQSSRRKRK